MDRSRSRGVVTVEDIRYGTVWLFKTIQFVVRLKKYISSRSSCHLQVHKVLPQESQAFQAKSPFLTTWIHFCGHKRSVTFQFLYATHLDSTLCFISALKRFVSISGTPNASWSDNAINFVGGGNRIKELPQLFLRDPHITETTIACHSIGLK